MTPFSVSTETHVEKQEGGTENTPTFASRIPFKANVSTPTAF